MKHVLIMTIMGDDRPDIVNALADKTRVLGAEWIKSKIIRLDGQFAALMKISIDKEQVAKLKEVLKQVFSDLSFSYAPVHEIEASNSQTYNLVLDCNDRPGLTKEITRVLYDLNLRPENLEVNRVPIFQMGKTVYSAKMRVGVPDTLSQEELNSALTSVCGSSRIHFENTAHSTK